MHNRCVGEYNERGSADAARHGCGANQPLTKVAGCRRRLRHA